MKPLSDHIPITTTNHRGKTVFTYEYGYYQRKYGWEAKAFIAHCLSRWDDKFEHLMDHFGPDHDVQELEIVDYWGPRLVKKQKETFPQSNPDFYREVWRAMLRTLILPQKLINDYFEKIGFTLRPDEVESGEKYFNRFNIFFGTDLKPIPSDWIGFGSVSPDGRLVLSQEFLELTRNTDFDRILQTISWLLSGFIKNFPLFFLEPIIA